MVQNAIQHPRELGKFHRLLDKGHVCEAVQPATCLIWRQATPHHHAELRAHEANVVNSSLSSMPGHVKVQDDRIEHPPMLRKSSNPFVT